MPHLLSVRVCVPLTLAALSCDVAFAQRQDIIFIGGRPYARTQIQEDLSAAIGIGDWITAADGVCYTRWGGPANNIIAYQFDRWLRRTAPPLDVGPIPETSPLSIRFRYHAGHFWLWYPLSGMIEMRRVRVNDGAVYAFPVLGEFFVDGTIYAEFERERVAVATSGHSIESGDLGPWGVYAQVLTYDGVPLGPRLHMYSDFQESVTATGTALDADMLTVSHTRSLGSADRRTAMQHTLPGGPAGPLLPIGGSNTSGGVLQRNLDSSLIVWTRVANQQAAGLYLSRYTGSGALAEGPVALGPRYQLRALADGSFITTLGGSQVQIELYGPDWVVIGPSFGSAVGTTRAIQELRGLDFSEDGTIWVSWLARDGFGADYYLTAITPLTPGDLDGDGRLTNFDIDPFVLALTNREAYIAAFPHIPPEAIDILGDLNDDGVLTNFDIDPFVDALVNGP